MRSLTIVPHLGDVVAAMAVAMEVVVMVAAVIAIATPRQRG
jgi:hypothetical protein